MSHIFGNVNCPECELETRFLAHINDNNEEFLLLGNEVNLTEEQLCQAVECDYCNREIIVKPKLVEGVISAFLNTHEFEKLQNGSRSISKAEDGEGLKREYQGNLRQFNHYKTVDFQKQPYAIGSKVDVSGQSWEVISAYRKEGIEKDPVKRIHDTNPLEYWYEVQVTGDIKETRWLIVYEGEMNNSVLTQERPRKKETEKVYDVSESMFKTMKVFTREHGESYQVTGYKYISGYRVLLMDKEGSVEMDVFAETIEEAMKSLEDCLAIQK